MKLFEKLLEKTGLAYLFSPAVDDEKERLDVIAWLNHHLLSIIDSVEKDIELEKQGLYPHPDNQSSRNERTQPLGYIQYELKDKYDNRLELSQFSLVSCNSIKMTHNYQRLKAIAETTGYSIELKEINIDGDGVDTYEELDEYTDDFERYFVITISGWQ